MGAQASLDGDSEGLGARPERLRATVRGWLRGLGGERGRSKLLVWAGAVGIAMPFYWMGFILRDEFYLVPGLLLVLLARLAARSEPKGRA